MIRPESQTTLYQALRKMVDAEILSDDDGRHIGWSITKLNKALPDAQKALIDWEENHVSRRN